MWGDASPVLLPCICGRYSNFQAVSNQYKMFPRLLRSIDYAGKFGKVMNWACKRDDSVELYFYDVIILYQYSNYCAFLPQTEVSIHF